MVLYKSKETNIYKYLKLNLKELFYFSAKCLTLDEFPNFKEKIIEVFKTEKIVVEDFIKICDTNLILPAIFLKFKSHQLLYLFPEPIGMLLESVYNLNKKRNLHILQQIDEINKKLSIEKINPVYFKGTANLLDGLYSDVGERMIGDIDLIVKDEDYSKTVDLIFELGYSKQPDRYHDGIDPMHYPPLYRDDMPAVIEIHRTPVDFKYARLFSTATIFEQFKPIQTKENCFVPSDEHKIIHNFIHSQLADLGYLYKRNSLRDLYDLYLLSLRMQPALLINKVEKQRRFVGHLKYTEKVFNTKDRFCSENHQDKNLHIFLCDFSLNHARINNAYCGIIKTVRIFKYWYLDKIIKAFYRKEYRRYIFRRISNSEWYEMHINRVKNFFRS